MARELRRWAIAGGATCAAPQTRHDYRVSPFLPPLYQCPLAPLHAMVLNISTASSLVDKVTLLPSPSRNDFPAY